VAAFAARRGLTNARQEKDARPLNAKSITNPEREISLWSQYGRSCPGHSQVGRKGGVRFGAYSNADEEMKKVFIGGSRRISKLTVDV
jgi:hypothetical protein